jgi:hypothetical protein
MKLFIIAKYSWRSYTMITFKRVQALPASTNSPVNKGVLFNNPGANGTLTLNTIDANGSAVAVTYHITTLTSVIVPFYIKSWAIASGAVGTTAFTLN